jgi:predicted polyphosphate/ATP-dependent NAD kinase
MGKKGEQEQKMKPHKLALAAEEREQSRKLALVVAREERHHKLGVVAVLGTMEGVVEELGCWWVPGSDRHRSERLVHSNLPEQCRAKRWQLGWRQRPWPRH